MKSLNISNKNRFRLWSLVFGFLFLVILSNGIFAQSTNQGYPTPVTSNEISGRITARDIGDARLTSYFYVFNGNQGDIFVNVVTKNLDGDIDIFTADNLRPLTKITLYADNPDSETGRVVYLRQPQKLILRIEGKSPTDEPATFRIKFAGSFEAIAGTSADTDDSNQPQVKTAEQGDVRVNSVGTIIEVKPKPTPKPKTSTAKIEKPETKEVEETQKPEKIEKEESETVKKDETAGKVDGESDKKYEVVVTENLPAKDETKNNEENKSGDASVVGNDKTKPEKNIAKQVKPKKPKVSTTAKTAKSKTAPEKPETAIEPALLENIRLIVLFKDGTKIERPMSEILKVSVDKGILTVIAKDGTIGRYSILDVAKMTIE